MLFNKRYYGVWQLGMPYLGKNELIQAKELKIYRRIDFLQMITDYADIWQTEYGKVDRTGKPTILAVGFNKLNQLNLTKIIKYHPDVPFSHFATINYQSKLTGQYDEITMQDIAAFQKEARIRKLAFSKNPMPILMHDIPHKSIKKTIYSKHYRKNHSARRWINNCQLRRNLLDNDKFHHAPKRCSVNKKEYRIRYRHLNRKRHVEDYSWIEEFRKNNRSSGWKSRKIKKQYLVHIIKH